MTHVSSWGFLRSLQYSSGQGNTLSTSALYQLGMHPQSSWKMHFSLRPAPSCQWHLYMSQHWAGDADAIKIIWCNLHRHQQMGGTALSPDLQLIVQDLSANSSFVPSARVQTSCSQCCCHGAGTAAPSPSSVGLNHATNCQLQTALALMTPKSLSMQNRKVGYRWKKKAVQRQPQCRMLLVQQMVQGCGSEFKHCRETVETSMGWSPREHDKECCCARVCNRQILGKTRFSNFMGIFFPLLLDFDSSRAVAEVWTWKHNKPEACWVNYIAKEKQYHYISHENLPFL